MDFILTCVKIGFGCAVGVTAFFLTLLIVLGIVIWLGQLGKEK